MQLALYVVVTYGIVLFVLSLFSLNRYVMISLFRRYRKEAHLPPPMPKELPVVTVQLPIFNELYVAERLIRSACRLDYPRHLLHIQVLDDSTDETLALTRRLVHRYRARGINIEHLHRAERVGYKSGALAYGLERAKGELIAVFDADFVIPREFLRHTVPYFADEHVGVVQTRWAYLNEDYSLLTRVTALGLSGQFVIEQPARDWGGLFLTFNGTAGILRAQCIRDAGGWHHDTITEDLDLSYRAQMAGWHIKYLSEVECQSELPADIHALKAQQFRWTKGSQETARKLLGRLWRTEISTWQKLQGAVHLLGNSIYPFLLAVGILNPMLMFVAHRFNMRISWPISAYFLFSLGGTFSYYAEATRVLHRDWLRRVAYLPLFLGSSIGLSIYNAQAALEGLFGKQSPFIRTPKYRLTEAKRSFGGLRYHSAFTWSTVAELAMGAYTTAAIVYAIVVREYGALPFLILFAFGYLLVGIYSVQHLLAGRTPRQSVVPLQPARHTERRRHPATVSPSQRVVPLIIIAIFVLHLSACDRNAPSSSASVTIEPAATVAGPATRPPGFETIPLTATQDASGVPNPPAGEFWYRPGNRTLEWFVRVQHLTPMRAYRVEITVDDGAVYSIASLHADTAGLLAGHGVLTQFADRVCVANAAPPQPLAGVHALGVSIKEDGSPTTTGQVSLSLTSPTNELPCSGNGDNRWGYMLMGRGIVRSSRAPAAP